MSSDSESVHAAISSRSRYMRRVREHRNAGDRLACFAELQKASFRVLRASPRGYRHFLERNLSSRCVKVIDGEWRPVSPARRSQQT